MDGQAHLPGRHAADGSPNHRGGRGRLVIKDWHNFGRDYDPTLMAWMANVDHHWQELQDLGYAYSWNYRSVCGITLTP